MMLQMIGGPHMYMEQNEIVIRPLTENDYPLLLNYIDEDDNEVRCALQICREKKPSTAQRIISAQLPK